MAEYIKKEELLKFKADVYDEDGHVLYAVPTGCIVAMPPADVMPMRHGQWIIDSAGRKIACSDCGCIYLGYNGRRTPILSRQQLAQMVVVPSVVAVQ